MADFFGANILALNSLSTLRAPLSVVVTIPGFLIPRLGLRKTRFRWVGSTLAARLRLVGIPLRLSCFLVLFVYLVLMFLLFCLGYGLQGSNPHLRDGDV